MKALSLLCEMPVRRLQSNIVSYNALRIVTVNALSLRPAKRRMIFTKQLSERRVHLAGIQDARATKDAVYVNNDFLVIATAADKAHNFGCELWISRTRPFAEVASQVCPSIRTMYMLYYQSPGR